MILQPSPQRSDEEITYEVSGDDLIIDGTPIDLSGNWAVLESGEDGFPHGISGGTQEDGEITVTVLAPYRKTDTGDFHDPPTVELLDGESVTFPEFWEAE